MSRRQTNFYIKLIIISLFILILFGYGIFEIWDYATGPKITIISPENGSVVSDSFVNITGEVKNTKEICLNNRGIMIDPNGHFSEGILLSYGYNVLEIKSKDRFGKEIKEILQIVYK